MTGEVRDLIAQHRRLQPWRAVAYLLLGAGGVILQIDPSRNVEPLPVEIRWVWSSFVVGGALVSMLGAWTDRWIGEFVGLPLLAAGMGGLLWILASGTGDTARLAFACFLGSIVWTLIRRWKNLWKFVNALRSGERRRR